MLIPYVGRILSGGDPHDDSTADAWARARGLESLAGLARIFAPVASQPPGTSHRR